MKTLISIWKGPNDHRRCVWFNAYERQTPHQMDRWTTDDEITVRVRAVCGLGGHGSTSQYVIMTIIAMRNIFYWFNATHQPHAMRWQFDVFSRQGRRTDREMYRCQACQAHRLCIYWMSIEAMRAMRTIYIFKYWRSNGMLLLGFIHMIWLNTELWPIYGALPIQLIRLIRSLAMDFVFIAHKLRSIKIASIRLDRTMKKQK